MLLHKIPLRPLRENIKDPKGLDTNGEVLLGLVTPALIAHSREERRKLWSPLAEEI